MSLSDVFRMWEPGEPSRLDVLWREHEKLSRRLEALTDLLEETTSLTRSDLDRRVAAREARESTPDQG